MGGGPSQAQNNAAQAQAGLANQEGAAANSALKFMQTQQNKVNPFYTSRMTNGLPYMNQLTDSLSGTNARAFAPARQQLMQQLGTQQGLPSGYRTQALMDFNDQQAQGFDQQLMGALGANEQAKQAGASGLLGQAQIANPQGFFSGAMQGNSSIMQAPLQSPGLGGLLGGVAGGLASKIPF